MEDNVSCLPAGASKSQAGEGTVVLKVSHHGEFDSEEAHAKLVFCFFEKQVAYLAFGSPRERR